MGRPIAELADKIAVSERILAREEPPAGLSEIGFQMVCEELEKDMPRLRKRLAWLQSEAADRRLRYAETRRRV